MWFSMPAKLNDTFEFSLPLFVHLTPLELVEHFEKRFKIDYVAPTLLGEMMKHGGAKSFPATEQFLRDFLNATDADNRTLFVIALVHFLREQGLTTQVIAERLDLAGNSELRERLERELREAYDKNQDIGRYCGILSLSAKNNDPLMWAHYADSCKGMCIGVTLDVDELARSDFIPLWVKYADELPVLGASAFFERQPANVMDMLKVFYATKYSAWKYEAEFRLVSKRGDLALDLPGRITEVILGEKVSDTDARNALAAIQERTGTKFLKMMREPGTWKYRAYGSSI